MSCDIIIPVWNQLEATKACIESIFGNTDYPYRLILVDNGSEKETKIYLESLKDVGRGTWDVGRGIRPEVVLIRNEKNLGFVKAVNQGIAASRSPYLCIMNNDTIATNGWLTELIRVMVSNPEIGLINPSSNTSGQFPGESVSIDDYAKSLGDMKGRIQELYTCRGFCMVVRREVIERLGPLDEVYRLGYFDDTDYCKRAQEAGYRTARAKSSYVFHKENTSFKEMKDNTDLFKNNEKIFFERWGKPLRIGYFIEKRDSGAVVNDIAIGVARSGYQINIFIRKGWHWPVSLDHFDIRGVTLSPFLFGLVSFYKIMKRKKKKRLDALVTDSPFFGNCLKLLKYMHGTPVFVNPGKEELLSVLKDMSKTF